MEMSLILKNFLVFCGFCSPLNSSVSSNKNPNDRCLLCFQTTPAPCGLKTFDGVFSVKTESEKGSPPGLYIRLSNLVTFPLRHHHCYVQCQKKVTPGQNLFYINSFVPFVDTQKSSNTSYRGSVRKLFPYIVAIT